MAVEGFSSPSMRARAHLVRGLQLVDDMERAWVRRDYWTARELARRAGEEVRAAGDDFEASWTHTDTLEAVEGETETELRMAHGDR